MLVRKLKHNPELWLGLLLLFRVFRERRKRQQNEGNSVVRVRNEATKANVLFIHLTRFSSFLAFLSLPLPLDFSLSHFQFSLVLYCFISDFFDFFFFLTFWSSKSAETERKTRSSRVGVTHFLLLGLLPLNESIDIPPTVHSHELLTHLATSFSAAGFYKNSRSTFALIQWLSLTLSNSST